MAFQPKLNPIRQEMIKEMLRESKMDAQNTLNHIIEKVYSDKSIRKAVFKR